VYQGSKSTAIASLAAALAAEVAAARLLALRLH